ncbi:MAG TPA: energy transducer TonB [Pyrinomonadaceae bacterium]|nr:energy transducer TonB [Pyrinomonadaceae bacterium]
MYFRRLHWALAVVMLAAFAVSGQVQKSAGDWAEWETISPEGEEFTVSMPKNPTTETTKFPYHKMELNARSYLATKAGGPVFAIVSLSGIKSIPGQYSDFARFNSYIDAFKDYFPPKVRTKDTALTKLVLVSSRPFHGHTGRQYKVSIGELSGTAHAFATRKRFYVVVSLNPKDEAMQEKFFTSFVLPERQVEQPKIAAAGEQPNAQQGQTGENAQEKTLDPNAPAGSEGTTENAANNANNKQPEGKLPEGKKPINGGMLNGKAIYLPHPEVASAEATGVVLVQVLIDENGAVIEAKAVSGPQHLQTAAVNAARLARFSPTTLMGEPVKVAGTLSYNFTKSN